MMSLSGKAKVLEKLAIDNSPVLLTAVGVAGTIGTAILSMRAARKADRLLDEAGSKIGPDEAFGLKEEIKATWTAYIPPVVSGAATIGAIVMANHIGTKRAAALAAAYSISEKAYSEYREKVIERIGEKDESKVRNDIAQDRVNASPPVEANVLMVSGGDHLFMEMYTGRYFRSDIETIRKAMNEVNYSINVNGYASMSDFYDLINLPRTSISDEMGWRSDKLMDIAFNAVLSEDGQPCVAINFITGPVRDFGRFR